MGNCLPHKLSTTALPSTNATDEPKSGPDKISSKSEPNNTKATSDSISTSLLSTTANLAQNSQPQDQNLAEPHSAGTTVTESVIVTPRNSDSSAGILWDKSHNFPITTAETVSRVKLTLKVTYTTRTQLLMTRLLQNGPQHRTRRQPLETKTLSLIHTPTHTVRLMIPG